MSPKPFLATMTLVIRSGMDVPAARKVRPITLKNRRNWVRIADRMYVCKELMYVLRYSFSYGLICTVGVFTEKSTHMKLFLQIVKKIAIFLLKVQKIAYKIFSISLRLGHYIHMYVY
jgi:hypothetical protein